MDRFQKKKKQLPIVQVKSKQVLHTPTELVGVFASTGLE